MNKILFINACARPDSRTLELAKFVISTLPGQREYVDLYNLKILPLDKNGLGIREKASCLNNFSDDVFKLAKQFSQADTIVIAAPYWDMMFPAVLKTYLENLGVDLNKIRTNVVKMLGETKPPAVSSAVPVQET